MTERNPRPRCPFVDENGVQCEKEKQTRTWSDYHCQEHKQRRRYIPPQTPIVTAKRFTLGDGDDGARED